uniref:Uncharacterized protein n=1 Tax=Rhizophora mucronata TaxID=61149 RepID=A0A2P2M5E5_RHIMU
MLVTCSKHVNFSYDYCRKNWRQA